MNKDSRIILRLKLLNFQIDLPIDPFISSQVQYVSQNTKKENVVCLPVNFMRLFYILANNTSKKYLFSKDMYFLIYYGKFK